jgi:hypothetical protein
MRAGKRLPYSSLKFILDFKIAVGVSGSAHAVLEPKYRSSKRSQLSPAQVTRKRTRSQEIEEAENEIRKAGLNKYCSVLSF